MRTTTEGIELIKQFESCSLTAYWDALGMVWTIGWGRARGVKEGDSCTQEQADEWLLDDITHIEAIVLGCVGPQVELTDNQLSALVSFCYNVGLGYTGKKDGFLVLKTGEPSTLLRCIRQGRMAAASDEFPKWCKADGQPNAGILRRRMAEQALFLKPEVPHAGG